jgi:MFS family permease
VVAFCFLAAVFTWGLGVFGASVYLHEVTKARGWSVSIVSAAITVFYLTAALVLPAVGAAIERRGSRPVIAGGAVLLALGVAAMGHVAAPWQLHAAFVCLGLGYATMSVIGLSATIAPWFEKYQGRAVAMALAGASVGAMAVVPLVALSIARHGFSATTTGAAAVAAITLVPLALVALRYRGPAELGLGRDGAALLEAGAGAGTAAAPAWTRAQAIRSLALWSVAVGFALGLIAQVGFFTHQVKLAEPVNAAAIFATQALALVLIASAPGAPVLVGMTFVYGFCLGQITTLSPIIVRREFGAASFGTVYGVAGTVIQLSSAFGPALYGIARDLLGSYPPVLAMAAGLELAALAVILAGGRSPSGSSARSAASV